TPTPAGTLAFSTASGPGWADPKGEWHRPDAPTLPLPREWGRFNGMYLHGKRVVLSYTVNDVEVRESPWLETIAGENVFIRTVEIGPSKQPLRLLAGEAREITGVRLFRPIPPTEMQTVLRRIATDRLFGVFLASDDRQISLAGGSGGQIEVRIPASE